jgi:hypothetical protein
MLEAVSLFAIEYYSLLFIPTLPLLAQMGLTAWKHQNIKTFFIDQYLRYICKYEMKMKQQN